MKITLNPRRLTAIAITAALAWAHLPAAWAGSTNTWKFVTNATQLSTVSGGPAIATVVIGDFGTGYKTNDPVILGNAVGVWDMGRNGTVTLSNLVSVIGGPGQARSFTINVVQFHNDFFPTLATVSIPGAQCVQTNQLATAIPSLGNWVVNETQWSVAPGATVNAAVVTSAYFGSLFNQVSLVSANAVIAPSPQLTIQRLGANNQQVQISWPANTAYQLQATGDLSNPQWVAVTVPVQVTGNVNFATLDATNAMQFYRLEQP